MDCVVSTFHYLESAPWENHYNFTLANMTVIEYAQSLFCLSNCSTWSLRSLLGHRQPLMEDYLAVAKGIVRRKILVLMVDNFELAL